MSKTDLGLIITDTHLEPKSVELNRSIWKQAVDTCIERGITRIYHGGDVFDSRKSQTQEMLTVLSELLEMVSEAGIRTIMIPGNHDKTDYQSENSFLHTFRFHPNVMVVRDYWCEDSSTNEEFPEDLHLFFCPFFDEKSGRYSEVLQEHISKLKNCQGTKILLTHIGVNDAVMNGGTVIQDSLEGSIFSGFDKVYVGHFHDQQELKGGKINYIGSAFQSNFGEDTEKGFQILKSDDSLEFIKSEFPEYKKVTIDLESATRQDIIELKKEYEGSTDNIRFEFIGKREKLQSIDKNEFISLGIDVKTKEDDANVVDYSDMEITVFDDKKIKEEWEKFTEEDEENQEIGNKYLNKVLK